MDVSALLLTGGRSSRMGYHKASVRIEGTPIAVRLARELLQVADPVLEIGPGFTDLPSVRDEPAGSGPLFAVAAGVRALQEAGRSDPVLVIACDLPLLTSAALGALAGWPHAGSVLPEVGDRPQTLCARWSVDAQAKVLKLVAAGERSMKVLLGEPDVRVVASAEWPEGIACQFEDADEPADLDRLGVRWSLPSS